jgi:hypothetical protein
MHPAVPMEAPDGIRLAPPLQPVDSLKRVSSPPVGTFSAASDITDEARSQQQASKR